RAAHPRLARLLDRTQDALRLLVRAEPEQHLIQDDVVQHLRAERPEPVRERLRVLAAALDELADPAPAEGTDGGVDGEPACPAGVLRVPVDLVPRRRGE